MRSPRSAAYWKWSWRNEQAVVIDFACVDCPVCGGGDVRRRKGLFNQRLGMFVHWGIYSVNGWHEQEEMRGKMPRSEYEKVAERFTAEKFDADAFVDAAELLGAEYIVFTSKHHDGFCMWDTATTDFKVTNTPTKRDVLKEVAEACRRREMKLGLYYSNPDWHHPNAHNEKSTHQIPLQPGDEPDMATVLNDGASAECELVVMPGRWEAGRRTLHVGNIAAAKYADESLVVRLDFPESASEKLAVDRGDRVRDVLERYVGVWRISGVVSAVSDRSGKMRFDCVGWADVENRVPMATNTMFAVFSMTKTFNGAAIMAAIDDGVMSLDDEVSKFLPEFADVKVRETNGLGQATLVPPKRPLTIRDLVTHTSGSRFSPPIVKRAVPLREIARQMAADPLVAHPGETFSYGNAWVDASAAALEVAVGIPYENWLEARILGPLGMKDTTFVPSPEQASRMVRAYTSDDGQLRLASDGYSKQLVFPWTEKVYPAASAGLFSTPADMARFSQMLAAHG